MNTTLKMSSEFFLKELVPEISCHRMKIIRYLRVAHELKHQLINFR